MSLQTPTPIPDASRPLPSLSSMGTWAQDMEEMHRWMREDLGPGAELLADQTYANASAAVDAGVSALASANFKGQWSDLSGPLAVPSSVWHSSRAWALLSYLSDVTLSEPGVTPDWVDVGGVNRSGDTMAGHLNGVAGAAGANLIRADEVVKLTGGAARIPSWATVGRPASPSAGDTGFNTDLVCNETWNGTHWVQEGWQKSTSVTASGTSLSLTAIPPWAKEIAVRFNGLSLSGSSSIIATLNSETSGYVGYQRFTGESSVSGQANPTNYFLITASVSSATTIKGELNLVPLGSPANSWLITSEASRDDSVIGIDTRCKKTLAAALSTIQIGSQNGTDTFDSGSITIYWRA